MQQIPLQAVPAQQLTTNLNNQSCLIIIYQKQSGLYLDLYIDSGATLIIGGVLCEDKNRIVRDLYLGFSGDLAFIDNQGDTDPVYTGLGSQYSLMYISPDELPSNVG